MTTEREAEREAVARRVCWSTCRHLDECPCPSARDCVDWKRHLLDVGDTIRELTAYRALRPERKAEREAVIDVLCHRRRVGHECSCRSCEGQADQILAVLDAYRASRPTTPPPEPVPPASVARSALASHSERRAAAIAAYADTLPETSTGAVLLRSHRIGVARAVEASDRDAGLMTVRRIDWRPCRAGDT